MGNSFADRRESSKAPKRPLVLPLEGGVLNWDGFPWLKLLPPPTTTPRRVSVVARRADEGAEVDPVWRKERTRSWLVLPVTVSVSGSREVLRRRLPEGVKSEGPRESSSSSSETRERMPVLAEEHEGLGRVKRPRVFEDGVFGGADLSSFARLSLFGGDDRASTLGSDSDSSC